MITFNDLIDSGIILQAKNIIVKRFDKEYKEIIISQVQYEQIGCIHPDTDGEIKYIYADKDNLIIEIE